MVATCKQLDSVTTCFSIWQNDFLLEDKVKNCLILQSTSPSGLQDDSTMLPSEGLVNDMIVMDATAVLSEDGEMLKLAEKVSLFMCFK